MAGLGQTRSAQGRRPIFLHGLWRSGSTYYWSRFRALDDTLCFYEPLHHGLAKLTPERIARGGIDAMQALHHPAMGAPYFAEYAPLIARRGVRHYRRSLAYDRYCLSADAHHPALERYVGGLVEHAAAQGRHAVLGFNRSCGRVGWLKRRFNAFDIHIDREPASIWASYAAERAHGNDTFFSMWLRVLEANQGDPLWAPLADRLKPRGPLMRHLSRTRSAHRTWIAALSDADSYLLVFYAWLATATASMAASDLVIDDGLLLDTAYARRIEDRIAESTGLRVDLADARASQPRTPLNESVRREVEAQALALFPRGALARRTPVMTGWTSQLCPRKAALVAALA